MSIKIDTTQLGCNGDHIAVEYSEEGSLDIRIVINGITYADLSIGISEARELAAALYGLVHLA